MASDAATELVAPWGLVPPAGKSAWLRLRLIEAINGGLLPPGSSLPGARDLAQALGVARGTAEAVYSQLLDEGFIRSQPRRRPVVARRRGPGPPALAPATSAAPPPTPGVPDAGLFPHRAWAAASRTALANLTGADLGYPDPTGHAELRAELAAWLGRTRGVSASPDEIHVTYGVAHALWLLAAALDAESWAVEKPGSPGATHHLVRQPVDVRLVPVDDAGLDPSLIPRDSGAVLVTPSHQYPTGVLMPPERRRELVDACRTAGRWIVEDDYDSHLAAPGVVPSAMQAFAPDVVILIGSLSKILAPGLRLGWIVAPPSVGNRLRALREQSDLGVSTLLQLTAANLISSGALDRHLRRARNEYLDRRTRLATALRPRWSLDGVPVGLHAFARTPAPDVLVQEAERLRVLAVAVDDDRRPGVILSIATVA